MAGESKTNRRRQWLKLLGLLVSLSLFVYVLSILDFEALSAGAQRLSAGAVLVALGVYLLLNFMRALRFRELSGQHLHLSTLYPITLYHNFLVRILPFRLGEAMYPILLQRHFNRPVMEGVSNLASARLFELLVVIAVGGAGFLNVSLEQPLPAVILLMVMIAGGMWTLYHANTILRRISSWVGVHTGISTILYRLSQHFEPIHNPRIFWRILALSVITFSLSLSFDLWLMRALGLQEDIVALLTAVSVMMLVQAVPIATVSGFGTVESGYVFGLVTFAGVDLTDAAAVALLLHVLGLLAAFISGILGYAALQIINRNGRQETRIG